ncbi:MAG: RNA polymerase sigma factor [Acidimicrobiales bacterium]
MRSVLASTFEVEGDERQLTALVEHARAGSQESWNAIVDQFADMVWSVVRSFRLSEADARDAAQMTWLRAVESLDNIREPERLGLWLATTARNECLRLVARRNKSVPVDPLDPLDAFARLEMGGDVQLDQISRSEAQRVLDALATLEPECQAFLRLVLVDPPMSYAEISAVLNIPIGSIGPKRQRCLLQLRAAAGI